MKKFKLIIVLLIATKLSFASVPHIYALHINGINVTRKEAFNNTNALRGLANVNSNMVTFDYVWNPTGEDANKGFWTNLFDVMIQKALEHFSTMSLDDFTQYWMKFKGLNYPVNSKEYQDLKAHIAEYYKKELDSTSGFNFDTIVNEFHGKVPVEFKSVVSLVNSDYKPNPQAKFYEFANKNDNQEPDQPISSNMNNSNALYKPNFFGLDLAKYQAEQHQPNINPNVAAMGASNYSKNTNMVLLLPHSQGNLYANALYNYLTGVENLPKNQIAIYGIATPADENIGGWPVDLIRQHFPPNFFGYINSYITSANDFVINSARTLFDKLPSPGYRILPPNANAGFSLTSPLGHNLIDVYLGDKTTSTQISKMINLYLVVMGDTMTFSIIPYMPSSPPPVEASLANLQHFGIRLAGQNSNTPSAITSLNGVSGELCNSTGCNSQVSFITITGTSVGLPANYGNETWLIFPKDLFASQKVDLLGDLYGNAAFSFLNANGVKSRTTDVYCGKVGDIDSIICRYKVDIDISLSCSPPYGARLSDYPYIVDIARAQLPNLFIGGRYYCGSTDM